MHVLERHEKVPAMRGAHKATADGWCFSMLVLTVVVGMVPPAAPLSTPDPTWETVSQTYPLLAHSREALGVPDHPVAAALDIAKQDDPICTVVYPLQSPDCSPVSGMCTTSDVGSARFALTVTTASAGSAIVGLNCSHSSTRSLAFNGFAPVVVAAGPTVPMETSAGPAIRHNPDTRNSCSAMSPAGTWTEYGNDCAGWYCSAGPPQTTSFCQRPDICSGCPNTPQCRANCSGGGQLRNASCDCVDTGGVCRLLGQHEPDPGKSTPGGIPTCRLRAPSSPATTAAVDSLALNQTVFGSSAGMLPSSPLTIYVRLVVSVSPSAPTGMRVAASFGGVGGGNLTWASQAAAPGETLTFCASLTAATGAVGRAIISEADFQGNLTSVMDFWDGQLATAAGPTLPEQRVATAWKAWLANSLVHVRRGPGLGPKGQALLYPQDGVLFYEAVYGYSAALYVSMLVRYGLTDHASRYIDSLLAMLTPEGQFTINYGLPDHGALLLAMSDYFLMTRDEEWLASAISDIGRMVSWVKTERARSMANQTKGSPVYGLIYYRPYCDHPAPTYSFLTDTYLVVGLEAIARALTAAPVIAHAGGVDPSAVWEAAAAYRSDVEAAVMASVLVTPSGLRTVPVFPATHELVKAGNWTARNYYVLTGCNLLEHNFFDTDSPMADLIWKFIQGADGLVPMTSAARFDYPHIWEEEETNAPLLDSLQRVEIEAQHHHRVIGSAGSDDHRMRKSQDMSSDSPDSRRGARPTPPPVDPPLPGKELGMDHAYTYGYWRHRLRQGDPTPAITGLYSALAFGSSATFASVEVTLMDGSNCNTLPHLYSNTQQLRLVRDLVMFEEVQRDSQTLSGNLSVGWGIPHQWLADARTAHVTLADAPSVFGQVTLSIGQIDPASSNGLTASIALEPPRGVASPSAAGLSFVRLRLRPPVSSWGGLTRLTVDGRPATAVGSDLVEIPSDLFGGGKVVQVEAVYA